MKIYCSGIGGIGVSAYASLMNNVGHEVLGSDARSSELTKTLEEAGIHITYTQDGSLIDESIDLLVYSEAIDADGAERRKATTLNIPQQSYFSALGAMSKDHFVIAICGTHGKSSTTAMTAQALTEAQLDPTVVVGTKVPFLDGKNWRAGKSNLFVVEACEYKRSFHKLSPNIVLLLNADGDHFDAYATQAEYEQAYADFLDLLPADGIVITHMNDPICKRLAQNSGKTIVNADEQPLLNLQVIGKHMQQNAQLVQALATALPNVTLTQLQESLAQHTGCWRRLEYKGTTVTGAVVIDDYGHHPVEIAANIEALKAAYPTKNIQLVFQPHTHIRTIELYEEFLTCFTGISKLYIPNIYDVRSQLGETKVQADQFAQDIQTASGIPTVYTHSLEETYTLLQNTTTPDDVIVCMGAGDITSLATKLTS